MTEAQVLRDASCADDFDPNSLAVEEALSRIESFIKPIVDSEQVAVRSALGRVLAQDVLSPIDVPQHDNSGMDGYAVVSDDLPASGTIKLEVVGTSWAGKPFAGAVQSGQCARIMTGGVLPAGTDAVVMQEHVEVAGDSVKIGTGHRKGQHVRYAGEDLATGAIALHAGHRITPSDLGLAASLGRIELRVFRKPRITFFSTGDELRSLGEALEEGEVYDSNRYTLFGMLTQLGVDFVDAGVVRDDQDELRDILARSAQTSDAIITSAGASVGDADFVQQTLTELGQVNFWKIAMKPGRPLAFGKIDNALFFGLPGNPVSVMVTFYQFVLPALRRLMGQLQTAPLRLQVKCASTLKKNPGRMEFQRGVLEVDKNGEMIVRSTGEQGSGILSSMTQANCFIVLPTTSDNVAAGDLVEIEPFYGLM
ncbi:MAG: molybdopterin molybdotransferase MoeA [Gammaproteobacteria bacterium]|nr:molybdopterin molybdotransferase MoeA [Gammaproteobacteria bacterium]